MRTQESGPTKSLAGEGSPTPTITRSTEDGQLKSVLRNGYWITIPADKLAPMESVDSVQQATGIAASLLLEVHLGPEYSLLLLDRGAHKQFVEEPIIPGSKFTVSDRYLLVDMQFMMAANIRHGLGKDLNTTTGLIEMCPGSNLMLGRDPEYGTPSGLPNTVSRKHSEIAIGLDNAVTIIDCVSTNNTIVAQAA